jgi:hypothetical protein
MEPTMKGCVAKALLAILTITGAMPAQAPRDKTLTAIGGISAENGEFAFIGNRVTAHSDRDIFLWRGANGKRDLITAGGGAATFEVRETGIANVSGNVSSASAHEFQLCDSFDQISRSIDNDIRAVLPADAKVKTSAELINGRILVAYSKPGTDHYLLMLSLFESAPNNRYTLVGTEAVSDYGDYCGMQVLTATTWAMLVDEPGGSSDFSSVYFFAIQLRENPTNHR